MSYIYNNCVLHGTQPDDAANAALLKVLKKHPLPLETIARRLKLPSARVQQRLYRLSRKNLVAPTGIQPNIKWGLRAHIEELKPKPVSPRTVPSREPPDWRNGTLKYDLDAHRRLAVIGR